MKSLSPNFQKAHQRNFSEHLVEYFWLIVVWCPIFSLIFMSAFGSWTSALVSFVTSFLISMSCASFCYWGSYVVQLVINKTFYKFRGYALVQSMWRGIAISFLFLVPGLYVGFFSANWLRDFLGYSTFTSDFSDYRAGFFYGTFVAGAFLLVEIFEKVKNAEREAEITSQKLENEKLKAQVSALTAQMNPHLLFNSLNTIASTISTSPLAAEEMTVQLSELYRGVLAAAQGEIHSLEKELSICQAYLEIEKSRFGDRVQYEFIVSENINTERISIPVLMLQPLVENAIKHGIGPKREGGKITIEIDKKENELLAYVSDNGAGSASPKKPGTGTGLKNSESRIYLKYGERSRFDFQRNESGAKVSIQIPMELADA